MRFFHIKESLSESDGRAWGGDRYHRTTLKRIVHVVLTGNFRAEEGHHETYKNTEWAYKEYDITGI